MSDTKSLKYQERDKWFYVSPVLFPKWNYRSRYALGMSLNDFWAKDAQEYRFKINGFLYTIDSKKAQELGRKYQIPKGKLPYLIPKEEFKVECLHDLENKKHENATLF